VQVVIFAPSNVHSLELAGLSDTRVDVARFLLEASRLPIARIAERSGSGSARAMRRAFLAHVGVTPSDYRDRFRTSGDGSRPGSSDGG
jgi:transcriptional regulator GlxA family with amidase domain